jgi:hypothetical protein
MDVGGGLWRAMSVGHGEHQRWVGERVVVELFLPFYSDIVCRV